MIDCRELQCGPSLAVITVRLYHEKTNAQSKSLTYCLFDVEWDSGAWLQFVDRMRRTYPWQLREWILLVCRGLWGRGLRALLRWGVWGELQRGLLEVSQLLRLSPVAFAVCVN